MNQYFFILGRNPELSLAELHAVLPSGWKPLACSKEVLVAECEEFNVEQLMRRLGGTIKIGEIISRNTQPETHNIILELLGEATKNKKLFLGLSAYALDDKARLPSMREVRGIGMNIKRELQAQGHKVRLVTSKEVALSSVIVKKEKLLAQGAEIVFFYNHSNQALHPKPYTLNPRYISRTLAVQEFEEASARDFGRPVREMKVGMIPIQLAKIMVNLARAPFSATILDPFCGFGTILAEALLMGYRNLIGGDLEQKMVNATRKNLNWLFSNSRLPAEPAGATAPSGRPSAAEAGELVNSPDLKLLTSPAEQLSKHLPPRSVDAIVTEPYLGPTRPGTWNIKHETKKLADLYTSAFREFAKILKPGGRVVFIMPAFNYGSSITKVSDDVLPQIKNSGFTPTQLLPSNLPSPYTLAPSPSIIYSRLDQKVLREIFCFKLNA